MLKHGTKLLCAAMMSLLATAPTAQAQKRGGVLKGYNWESPPSASPHEEATNSTLLSFMPIFNNVVLFDQLKPTGTLETIVPEHVRSKAPINAPQPPTEKRRGRPPKDRSSDPSTG